MRITGPVEITISGDQGDDFHAPTVADLSRSVSFTVETAHGFYEVIEDLSAKHHAQEVARLREASRLSGMDVAYDLTMFDAPWSPVYRHDSDQPVAWVNNATGERREGSTYPSDDAAS